MSNPFSINNLLFPLTKGDTAGHPFHGNQFTAGQGGGGKDNADKIMDAVNKYGDENPDAQMNKGWQTAMEQAKMIGEHKMAIPKALVDSATKEDLDKLTDNNYHSARTAIEQQRPDLLTPSTREVNLGNYFKSESLLYPLTKGDTPGHPFHGNQFQAGQGGGSNSSPKPAKEVRLGLNGSAKVGDVVLNQNGNRVRIVRATSKSVVVTHVSDDALGENAPQFWAKPESLRPEPA